MNDPRAEALARLPHGPEFRFLTKVLSLEPGRTAVGEYRVCGDEPFLKGHFPAEPLFPGVLLVEAAAQLAGILAQSDPHIPPLPGLKLTALKNVKIFGTARPGECIRLEARVIGRLGNLVQAQVAAWVNDQKVMEGSLTLTGRS